MVAEKATLLVGRRIRNLDWLKQRLASTDARIRAAAVEGLWGNDTPSARLLLWQSGRDENSGVVAKALLGLHFLGDVSASLSVKAMACDARPSFRRSAVRVMRHIGESEFLEPLLAALADPDAEVRLGAKQALAAIRRQSIAKEAPQVPVLEAKTAAPVEAETPPVTAFPFKFDGSPPR